MTLYNAGLAPAVRDRNGVTVGVLTEDEGAIGGTNDGNLPDLDATATVLLENEAAVEGTDSEFATLDFEWDGLTAPSAAQATLLTDALRETGAQVNALIADVAALRAAVRENADKVNDLITHLNDGRYTL